MADRILIARIGAPHGVRGEVRLFVFAEDPGLLRAHALTDATGQRRFRLAALRPAKDHFVARFEGLADRTAAEALTHTDLYVPRDALPETGDADTFYHADLIGLPVEDEAGTRRGTVTGLHDFGAGDILEYAPLDGGKTRMIPFSREAVPVVDVSGGRVVIAQALADEAEQVRPEGDAGPADPDASEPV